MDRIERRLDNIKGNQYEERAINRILVRAAFLGIERPQVAFSKSGQYRQEVHDRLTAAVRTGLISQAEYYDLTEATSSYAAETADTWSRKSPWDRTRMTYPAPSAVPRPSGLPPANPSPQWSPHPTPNRSSSARPKPGT